MSLGGYESGLRASYAAVHQRLRYAAPLRIAAPPVKVEVAPVEVAEPPKPRARDMMMLASEIGPFRWKSIADQVCKKRGVPIELIRGDGRAKPVCAARHELCYRLYTETGMSLPQVGRFLSKDHSTVLHSVRRYKAILAEAGE